MRLPQGWRSFAFWLNLVWFLFIYLKVYRKKSSSIVLRKIKYVHYLDFSFEKHVPSQVLIDSSDKSLQTALSAFLLKFSSEIYFSRIISYWGIIFTLYLTWGAFSLVIVLSAFSLFFSIGIFLDTTYFSHDSRDGKGNHYFSCFPHPSILRFRIY